MPAAGAEVKEDQRVTQDEFWRALRARHPGLREALAADARVTALHRGERYEFHSRLDLIAQVLRLAWVSDAFLEAHPEEIRAKMEVFLANDIDCYRASCEMLGDADLRHYQPAMRMPASVIVGEEDYAAPVAMSEQMAKAMPNATLWVLPNVRHLTPIECPAIIAERILELTKPSAARI